MIDAMGGINSLHYKKFKTYCGRAYNCLRRHAPIFYTLLLSLTESIPNIDSNITKEHIKNHIYQRFIPGENYQTAFKQFIHKLDSNSNTFSEDIIDFFHKKKIIKKLKNIINQTNIYKIIKFRLDSSLN